MVLEAIEAACYSNTTSDPRQFGRRSEQSDVAYLLITHDLATVRYMCHGVRVMYLGKIVETGTRREIFSAPGIPTQALLAAALPADPDAQSEHEAIPAEIPTPSTRPLAAPSSHTVRP